MVEYEKTLFVEIVKIKGIKWRNHSIYATHMSIYGTNGLKMAKKLISLA